ncbi:MAG: DNA polymerase III subunit delta [Pseudomonadota bacterium]
MPRIDITELDKELRQGKIRPLYIIAGAEYHLASQSLRSIKEAVGKGGAGESPAKSLSGREVRADAVIDDLRMVPMLGGRVLVVIREAEGIPKASLERLADYAAAPVEASTLVLVAEKMDGRTRFMQTAAKSGAIIDCKPLYLDKVPFWINMEVKRQGRQMSMEAAKFLAEMIGSDLGQLSQAIERILLYVGVRRMVELKDVEQAVSETHQHTIFELTDAVGTQRLPKALSLLHGILENGESPILVLNMIARHFRILMKAKDIAGRVEKESEVAKYLGVHAFFAKNYIAQARNFSNGELKACFRTLHRCDRELKSSRLGRERIFERAFFAMIGR